MRERDPNIESALKMLIKYTHQSKHKPWFQLSQNHEKYTNKAYKKMNHQIKAKHKPLIPGIQTSCETTNN